MTYNAISRMDRTRHRITGSQFCANMCRCTGSRAEHDPHRIADHSAATEVFHRVEVVNPAMKKEGVSSSTIRAQVRPPFGKNRVQEESVLLGSMTMSCVLVSWCLASLMFWGMVWLDAQ